MFTTIVPRDEDPRARAVLVLFESRDSTIWCGTRKGLFRPARSGARFELSPVEIGLPQENPLLKEINDLVDDEHGSLWAVAPSGLYRRWSDGTAARYSAENVLKEGYQYLHDLMKDRQGRIWVGSRYDGFFRIRADATHRPPVIAEHHAFPRHGASWINRLVESSDGRSGWPRTSGSWGSSAGRPPGAPASSQVSALAEDRAETSGSEHRAAR